MQKTTRLSFIVDHLLQQPMRLASVNISVGELVVSKDDEIQAEWSQLAGGANLSGTQLIIQRILAEQQCMVCFQKYHPLNKETSCPHCGSVGAKILAGEEFYLESIEEESK
jgi:hydrogenase nickel incorporation protein HypA/HybF